MGRTSPARTSTPAAGAARSNSASDATKNPQTFHGRPLKSERNFAICARCDDDDDDDDDDDAPSSSPSRRSSPAVLCDAAAKNDREGDAPRRELVQPAVDDPPRHVHRALDPARVEFARVSEVEEQRPGRLPRAQPIRLLVHVGVARVREHPRGRVRRVRRVRGVAVVCRHRRRARGVVMMRVAARENATSVRDSSFDLFYLSAC